ncbi:N-formylglutamate deformylase [Oleiagrimonas soli]|uniref:N-formylglutamate amidohydrolase n=1 Tax=Oleiagrimonas soli TaxID=1543381 RepID=A0A099CVC3_9GAMM|nr:N-formylglutamate deformylase [Oleiagrimonas soli]KGI77626.1 N-formylglutamate amidohydrolase [Oleiagrimonas soli]MBB6182876.1 N-formylglutamate deformylase [Oleiagrimonas soli]
MFTFTLHRGSAPLLISLPHDGSHIPEALAARMTPSAQRSPDTDWHVGRLYAFARELGASILQPAHSRYVVDLNRPADGHALYPGQSETSLVPTIQFDGTSIYRDGEAPDSEDIAARVEAYWRPYHQALRDELKRLREAHGRVVLWEGHSIRAVVPMLFQGRLPDFNLGTHAGVSCHPSLRKALAGVLDGQNAYTHVVDGRFKGGYITRHYGAPDDGIDAVQLELAQCNYMDEATFEYLPEHAERVQPVIRRLLQTCLDAVG